MPILSPEDFLNALQRPNRAPFTNLHRGLGDEFVLAEKSEADSVILCGGSWGRSFMGTLRLLYAIHRALESERSHPENAIFQVITGSSEGADTISRNIRVAFKNPIFRGAVDSSQAAYFVLRGGIRLHIGLLGATGTVLGGLIDGRHPMGWTRERAIFTQLRCAMRTKAGSAWKGSLTWCSDIAPVSCDPRTTVLNLPTWAFRNYDDPNPKTISTWVIVRNGIASLTTDRSAAIMAPVSGGVVYPVPSEAVSVFEDDLATALRRHYGIVSV